jgi:hypothetical protein
VGASHPILLERELCGQLNNPWSAAAQSRIGLGYIGRLRDQSHRQQWLRNVSVHIGGGIRRNLRISRGSVVYISGGDVVGRQSEVWVVEDIEEFSAQLKVQPFGQPGVLGN